MQCHHVDDDDDDDGDDEYDDDHEYDDDDLLNAEGSEQPTRGGEQYRAVWRIWIWGDHD